MRNASPKGVSSGLLPQGAESAVDNADNTIDFLLRSYRHRQGAGWFFEKAIARNGTPGSVTSNKSGSSLVALRPQPGNSYIPSTIDPSVRTSRILPPPRPASPRPRRGGLTTQPLTRARLPITRCCLIPSARLVDSGIYSACDA